YGYHPLKINYRKTNEAATLKLFWESDQFEREPIPPKSLTHTLPQANVAKTSYENLQPGERGESLVKAYRCTACHDIPLSIPTLDAPSLTRIKGTIHPGW